MYIVTPLYTRQYVDASCRIEAPTALTLREEIPATGEI